MIHLQKRKKTNQTINFKPFFTMRFNLKKTLAFVAVGLMLPLFAQAQSIRISGTVTDKSGELSTLPTAPSRVSTVRIPSR